MIITCITHCDARDKKKFPFRGLTEKGGREADLAAERFRELITAETPKIETVISSPKARCVETAVLFAKAISDLLATSEIQLDATLKAGSIKGDELFELANGSECRHLLVAAHADLAKALPSRATLTAEAAKDGWFTMRPVLSLFDYEPGDSWDAAQILACEGLVGEEWQHLLQ